jgi:hypothetical protein
LPQPVSLIWDSLVHSLPQLLLDFLEHDSTPAAFAPRPTRRSQVRQLRIGLPCTGRIRP